MTSQRVWNLSPFFSLSAVHLTGLSGPVAQATCTFQPSPVPPPRWAPPAQARDIDTRHQLEIRVQSVRRLCTTPSVSHAGDRQTDETDSAVSEVSNWTSMSCQPRRVITERTVRGKHVTQTLTKTKNTTFILMTD